MADKKNDKPMSARKRAALKNLEIARVKRAQNKAKDDALKLSAKMADLSEDIDKEVERQIALRFKDVDRGILKNMILQVFHELGGMKRLKKFAKASDANYKSYINLMEKILRAESDKEAASAGGVTVNFDFGGNSPDAIDITPTSLEGLDASKATQN